MIWYVIVTLTLIAGLVSWLLLRRQKDVPLAKHHLPADIKVWAPKHLHDETAEFKALTPGRHATDTAYAMPAIRPEVPSYGGEMPTMWTRPSA